MKSNHTGSQLILADAHVHIHKFFDLAKMLDSAWKNFSQVAEQTFQQKSLTAILFLTEMETQDEFDRLKTQCDRDRHLEFDRWKIARTQEEDSLLAHQADLTKPTILMAGHQIVTAENMEVLALMMTHKVPSGLSLDETVQKVTATGGIPVLPWGFGKWMGTRGKILQNFLEKHRSPVLCLGDNGGRPTFWKRPTYFQQADEKKLRILPGSDPLPLAWEFDRAGSFGFAIEDHISLDNPARDMKQMLLNSQIPITAYGSLQNPLQFIRNQLAIRMR